ncbi:CD3072 family TudS-related putative desulfidase [Listeria costaricensis]|uniref:CD3072 family TudS-related putative desulfidase n=1 Tax=Listeria costaricensis TaxID=2026604 RepID=UPI0019696AFC|nr:CD3072 family TudS-related putative desulfidase [Listeria costaricensis]
MTASIERSRKMIIVPFCVLNQNAVIHEWERANGAFPFVQLILEAGVGLIQLPCPELIHLGMERPPLEYEDYNTAQHRACCQKSLEPTFWQIDRFLEADYEILGVLGIAESPNCAISGRRGVMMEIFWEEVKARGITLAHLEVPVNILDRKEKFEQKIRDFLQIS